MKASVKQHTLRVLPLALAIATALTGTNSYAASAIAAGTATVIAPMAISKNSDLRFGTFARSTAAGTVVMNLLSVRSTTGGITLSSSATGGAASFNVTGDTTYTYAITLPATNIPITSGGNTMTINSFVSNPSGAGTLSAGAQVLTVGGTLNVAANQAAGSYTGNFTVVVDYN